MRKVNAACFLVFLCACSTSGQPVINFDQAKERPIKLSEIVKSLELVVLESSPDALLNRPGFFAVSEDYVLVGDFLNFPAKLYERNGIYVSQIGGIGKGPGEYGSLQHVYIEQDQKTFWVQTGGNTPVRPGWFITYDQNGKFVEEFKTPQQEDPRNRNQAYVYNGQIITPGDPGFDYLISYRPIVSKEDSKKILRPDPEKYPTYLINNSSIYSIGDDELVCHLTEDETVYKIDLNGGKGSPYLKIKNTDFAFDHEAINRARRTREFDNIAKATEGAYSIKLIGETDTDYLFKMNAGGAYASYQYAMASKSNREVIMGNLVNDFLGDAKVQSPYFYQNEYLVFTYDAFSFLEALENSANIDPGIQAQLDGLGKAIGEEDNYIVFIGKLKSP